MSNDLDDKTTSQQLPVDSPAPDEYPIENEPYLGPAWAVAMLILYLLKQAFPAEEYTWLWWIQVYIIGIVVAVTLFTLVKRRQFYNSEKKRLKASVK